MEASGDHYSKALMSDLDVKDDPQPRLQVMFWQKEEFHAPPDL